MPTRPRAILATILAVALTCATGRGDEPTPQPAPPPAPALASSGQRPLLKQLNQEVQSLYHEVQAGVCRVQLPPPRWAAGPLVEQDKLNPLRKWADQLDPAVKARLEQEQKDADKGRLRKITAQVGPASPPAATATQPATQSTAQHGQSATQNAAGAWNLSTSDDVLIFRPGDNSAGALQLDAGGRLTPDGQIAAAGAGVAVNVAPGPGLFTPNNVGLLLDAQGHILVPICVEKEAFDPEGVRVMVGPGQMGTARFVGSDRQTNITLLKLDKPLGTPVKVAQGPLEEGTLALFLAPNSGVGRLIIWSNEIKDWGVVVSLDGGIYGFTRQGQFLSAAACKPAIDQLAKAGAVKRPKIGVGIVEVPQTDPARDTSPALGTRPAVRVSEIAPNSAAATAGLKVGDLILQLNDQPVGDPHGFAAAMTNPTPTATVKLLRDGKEQTITVELPKVP